MAGLRPVGGRTIGWGAGIGAGVEGGSMFASGASQGVADAGGATPIATMSPIAAANATVIDTSRENTDNVTPFSGKTPH